MTPEEVRGAVECLLFASASPVGAADMSAALEVSEAEVEQAARELSKRDGQTSGLLVEKVAGGWQLVTRPEYGRAVARFVGKRAQKLSRAALEVLAIVAYNNPCTQAEVESIRGVDSSGVLKNLIERGMVKESGRKEAVGRPILFGVTEGFLVYFGLNSLDDLPDAAALEKMLEDKQQNQSAQLPGLEDSESDPENLQQQ